MDKFVMLLCKYGSYTMVVRVDTNFKYDDLVHCLCDKWKDLRMDSVSMCYSLPGHPNCIMNNEVEFANMLYLVHSIAIGVVDVVICQNLLEEMNAVPMCEVDVDGETDLLPSFCKHQNKSLMTSGWGSLISHEGQKFEGGVSEFRIALSKYAIECGFQYTLVKNDKERVTAKCAFKESKGCLWRVHASVEKCNDFFYIRKLMNSHSCGAAVRSDKHRRMSSDLISSLILDQVHDRPLTRPSDVVRDFKLNYGMTISYHHAWGAVEKAKAEIYGDHSCSFDHLRWYMDEAYSSNPGSHFVLNFDSDTKCFKRFFAGFHACLEGFKHCRPLLFLDGTFLKGKFKGNLLAATAKDGNQGLFPVAFAIVDSENMDNWSWFLQVLSNVLDPTRNLSFISDRNVGLVEALPKVFPNAHHAYCLLHIKANLRDKLSGVRKSVKADIIEAFRECAYAPTEYDFNCKMNELIKLGGDKVQVFLENLPYKHWSHAHFKGQRYGEMSSNAAESFNSWIKDVRDLPITKLVDAIRVKIMIQMADRRLKSSKWNSIVCPKMDSRLQTCIDTGRSWIVSLSSEDVYEVHSLPSVSVDLKRRTCSCFEWQIYGFPCAHASAAILKSGKNLNEFVEQYFYVSAYQGSYSSSIFPIPTIGRPDFNVAEMIIRPPMCKRQPGRPKKKRVPSRGEKLRGIKCSRCGRLGSHNRKSCKEPLKAIAC